MILQSSTCMYNLSIIAIFYLLKRILWIYDFFNIKKFLILFIFFYDCKNFEIFTILNIELEYHCFIFASRIFLHLKIIDLLLLLLNLFYYYY